MLLCLELGSLAAEAPAEAAEPTPSCVTARLPRPRVTIDACFLHAGGLAEVITGVRASDVARRFSYPFGTQQPLPGLPMSGSKLFNCM